MTLEKQHKDLPENPEAVQANHRDAMAGRERLRVRIKDDVSAELEAGIGCLLVLKADIKAELVTKVERIAAELRTSLIQDLTHVFQAELEGYQERTNTDIAALKRTSAASTGTSALLVPD